MLRSSKEKEAIYTKYAHRIVLVIGALFLLSGAFQENIWFDEAYTAGLLSHPLGDMIHIASDDVHPIGYYIIGWLVYYPTKSIVLLRMLSVVFAWLLALLGYTHLRRDFGDREGFWFTLITFLLPSTFKYAGQMRMYTPAAFLVMLAAIYAYRYGRSLISEEDGGDANLTFFVLLSVVAAYTHHFALVTVCMINLFLLVFLLMKSRRTIKLYVGAAAAQLALYVPGFLMLVHQIQMKGAAGIEMEWSQVLLDTLAFHFLGDQKENAFEFSSGQYVWVWLVALLVTATMVAVFVWAFVRKKPHRHAALLAVGVYGGVLVVAWFVSLVFRPIFLERYTMVMYGLWIFAMAYTLAHIPFASIKAGLTAAMLCILILRVIPLYHAAYDPALGEMRDYLDEQLEAGDTFGYDNIVGYRFAVYYPEHKQYYYNYQNWSIEDAYKAFKNTEVFRLAHEAGKYTGDYGDRIWLTGRNGLLYWELTTNYGYTEVSSRSFYIPYYNCSYDLVLLEKQPLRHPSQEKICAHLDEHMQVGDTIGYEDIKSLGFATAYPATEQYFYNYHLWNMEEDFAELDNVDIFRWANDAGDYYGDYGDRIWVIGRGLLCWELDTNYGYTEVSAQTFEQSEDGESYELILMEKTEVVQAPAENEQETDMAS